MCKLAIDVLQLEHLVIVDARLGQQHVHVPGHAARHRVDGELHLDALLLKQIGHFAQRMLGLRHRHAVAGNDNDALGLLEHEGRVFGTALLVGALFLRLAPAGT